MDGSSGMLYDMRDRVPRTFFYLLSVSDVDFINGGSGEALAEGRRERLTCAKSRVYRFFDGAGVAAGESAALWALCVSGQRRYVCCYAGCP